ncbi:MAG: DinB superfamily protein [Acidobacteria bacterium]|nr:DinB superfamily protein [Acidobacteriota bacterium]
MRPIEQFIDRLNALFDGEETHGATLRGLLDGVSEEQARRHIGDVHSILEIVVHIGRWMDVVADRLRGEAIDSTTVADWSDTTKQSWPATIEELERAQSRLLDGVARTSPEALDRPIAGKDYTARVALEMVMNHNVYHTGQIALLKKLTA